MRGAPSDDTCIDSSSGIIPADAGSTGEFGEIIPVFSDHPRGCGEHLLIQLGYQTVRGSSPRMRGALSKQSLNRIVPRIIPADAGSTQRGRA